MPANPAAGLPGESLAPLAYSRANAWRQIAVAILTLLAAWAALDSVIWPWASRHFVIMNPNLNDYFNFQRIFHLW